MGRKLLTVEDLILYCSQHKLTEFTASEPDDVLILSIPAVFNKTEFDSEFFLKGRCRSCHTKLNLNSSYIEDNVMNDATPSFAYKPVLASIVTVEDEDGNSSLDFNGHDMIVTEDKMNPDQQRIEYIEQIVGVIPSSADNKLELVHDKETNKTFVDVDILIFRDYTYACDILEKRKNAAVSIEIAVSKFSYNAKEKYLNIEEFKLSGITLLGEKVKPGMAGANAQFSLENTLEDKEQMKKMQSTLEQLVAQLSDKLNYKIQEGGEKNLKIDELLEKYKKTPESIPFEYLGLDDEALAAKFEEYFGVEKLAEQVELTEPLLDKTNDVTLQAFVLGEISAQITTDEQNHNSTYSLVFQLSHEDVRHALYNLIGQYDEMDNEWYMIRDVYDDHFVMQGWMQNKIYGQKYNKDEKTNLVALEGDRWELFEELLTLAERDNLNTMRSNYEANAMKLAQYELNEVTLLEEQKNTLLTNAAYSAIQETTEFQTLQSNKANLTYGELELKADALLGSYTKAKKQIEIPKRKTFGVSIQTSKPSSTKDRSSFVESLQSLGKQTKK